MAVTDTIIRFTTNTKPNITVKENSINNTSTSLLLYGKSTLNPAKIINTNLAYILENFCKNQEPLKPIEGQIWCDTNDSDGKNEFGRLKINIKDVSGNIHFHDIAGTVMNIDGNLRHTGQIEASSEYNDIDQTHKDVYPEDVKYKKYLTTKKHCDENYLTGDYSSDNSTFNVKNDRKIKTQVAQTYTVPGTFDDDRFKLINKKYLDTQFLSGQNYVDHFIISSNTKKLYYTVDCLIDLPYQLITKKYVSDQDVAARAMLDLLQSSATDGLEQFVLDAEAAALAAKIAADEAWAALGTISPQTASSGVTFTSGGTTITGTITMMDVSIPTVNSYTGSDTKPIITGLLTTESTLSATATYEITIDAVTVPLANITTAATSTGFGWSIDTAYLNWVADTTHDVIVTRTEDATHSYVSTSHDQIKITSLIIPTVNTQTISNAALTCTITGTIGTSDFNALPTADSIKVVFNNLTYYRYNDPANPDNSSALTVTGGDWSLAGVPTPPVGKWDVIVTRNDNAKQVDSTTDEITVAALKDAILPTVVAQKLSSTDNEMTNVTVTGTVGGKNLTDSSSTFTVVVSNNNTPVTGTLTYDQSGINWTYTIPTISTGTTYEVTATRTDEYGNTFVDKTTGELTIQKVLDAELPTVAPQTVYGGSTVDVIGTVGSIKLSDSNSTFSVVVKSNNAPYVEEIGTTVTYDTSGLNWTYSLTNVPEDNIYDVTATRTDAYGNTFIDDTLGELVVNKVSHVFTGTFTTNILQMGVVNGVNSIDVTTTDTTTGTDIKSKTYSYDFTTYTVSGTTILTSVPPSVTTTTFHAPRDNTVMLGVANLVITFNDDTTTTLTSDINYPPPSIPSSLNPDVDGYYIGDFNGYKLYYAPKSSAQYKTMEVAYGYGSYATPDTNDGLLNTNKLATSVITGFKVPGSVYPAATYCYGLTLGNHEWYLPSLNELKFIWNNRSKLPSGQGLGSAIYSTSTRNGGDFFWILNNGSFQNKGTLRGIAFAIWARAVRREPI